MSRKKCQEVACPLLLKIEHDLTMASWRSCWYFHCNLNARIAHLHFHISSPHVRLLRKLVQIMDPGTAEPWLRHQPTQKAGTTGRLFGAKSDPLDIT